MLRLEDLRDHGPDTLGWFFQTKPIELGYHNRSSDLFYARTYRRFMQRLRLDDACLDRMCGSRLSRHFYSVAELSRIRARWTEVR